MSEIRSVTDNQTTNSSAGYIQTDFDLTQTLQLTLGGRYTYDTKDFDAAGFSTVEGVGAPGGQFGPALPTYHFLEHLNNAVTSGRVALNYRPQAGIMAYASLTTGFKAGGFNGGLLNNDAPDAQRQLQPIQPEDITAYEAGVKTDWLNNRLRLNGSGFYSQYHDLQIFNLVPAAANGGLPVNVLSNAPRAKVEGIDADFQAEPLAGLNLGATPRRR